MPSVKRFIGVAGGSVLLLSLSWLWLGLGYNALVLRAVAPFLPSGTTVEQSGHEIQVSALATPGGAGGVEWVMHSMAMSYGLIVAAAVLLALPRVYMRTRLLLVVATVVVAFVAHVAGLYMLVQRVASIAQSSARPEEIATLGRALTFAWLFIPSLVWLPQLFRQWWPAPQR